MKVFDTKDDTVARDLGGVHGPLGADGCKQLVRSFKLSRIIRCNVAFSKPWCVLLSVFSTQSVSYSSMASRYG